MCDKKETSKDKVAYARKMEVDDVGNSDCIDNPIACSSRGPGRAETDEGARANLSRKRHRAEGGNDDDDVTYANDDCPGEGTSLCGYLPHSNGAQSRLADEESLPSGDLMPDVIPSHVTYVMQNLDNLIQNVFRCLPIRALHNAARYI